MEAEETKVGEVQGPGGLSRRDLITRTAVAGGLVWAAPVLLASPAGAIHDPCACHDGLIYYIKISSQQGVNCGNITCSGVNEPRNPTYLCGECLVESGVVVISDLVFEAGTVRFSSITLGPDVELMLFCAQSKSANQPFVASCPDFVDPAGVLTVSANRKTLTADPATPLNEVGIHLCAPAGTPPPGC